LAQTLYTGTLDHIFDNSGEKQFLAGPYGPVRSAKNRNNCCQGYTTLGLYCHPMGGRGRIFFFLLEKNKHKKSWNMRKKVH
jgi:hypothetical protein